jgi:hypothetical protein
MKFQRSLSILIAGALYAASLLAQAPTGIISGTVTDSSGAVVPGANITITDKSTASSRSVPTSADGLFSAPSLPAGTYEVRAEAQGFRTTVREANVQVGTTTTANLSLTVGGAKEVVTVEAAAATINYESHTVQGTIQRESIQDLPLNGRSFLQLSTLEPGITTAPATTSQFNTTVAVTVLGTAGRTYITIDGASIVDNVEGGTAMNFSQEVVQEFQLSSANFDLGTGITGAGAINVVTRSGSNDFHGSGYFFFRDHNMAAFPGLKRPTDPGALNIYCRQDPASQACKAVQNPFFARRNPGFLISGPMLKNKAFFFFNLEHQNQVQAAAFSPDIASAAGLANIYSSPYLSTTLSTRFDYRLNDKNSLFMRYSHDGNSGFGYSSAAFVPQPSYWTNNVNWSDQSIVGVTSVLSSALVNDARVAFQYWSNKNDPASAAQCVSPCIGANFPSVSAVQGSASVGFGNNPSAPQHRQDRRLEFIESLNWQKGAHRMKFGGDVYGDQFFVDWEFCTPACLGVISPEYTKGNLGLSAAQVANFFPTLPAALSTNGDLLNLPVLPSGAAIYSGIGLGNGSFPGPYNFAAARWNWRPRFYAQDTWKVNSKLTVNYGLAYEFETGLFNTDLNKPAYLGPIIGQNNLAATTGSHPEFSPALGFAWSPFKNGKTVIRGGAGMYWDTQALYQRIRERGEIGPLGNGRLTLGPGVLTNTFNGIVNLSAGGASVPIGAALPAPGQITNMTLGQFLQLVDTQLPVVLQKLAASVPASGAFSATGIDYAKTGVELYPNSYKLPRSIQTTIGVQQDLGHDMVLTADWARKVFTHVQLGELDAARFGQYLNPDATGKGTQTPLVPVCTTAQLFQLGQECVTGAITEWTEGGRSVYNGLLMKLNKRLSHRYQFTVSYALQNNKSIGSGNQATIYSLNNYGLSFGPNLARHNLTVAGNVNLPYGIQLTMNSSFISRTPFNPIVPVDLSGTGVTGGSLLPGLTYNCANMGCSKEDLAKAVASFDTTYAGAKAPNGTTIPKLTLPGSYDFSQPTISQDIRLTKKFTYKERYSLSILGEVFNALNIANLSGYSGTLTSAAFGQPTQRVIQTFGSGGPRAFQFGGRISF